MRHTVSFIFTAVRGARLAKTDAQRRASARVEATPMVRLNAISLRSVTGGDGGTDLPKGGW
jgi:hypothetical protein